MYMYIAGMRTYMHALLIFSLSLTQLAFTTIFSILLIILNDIHLLICRSMNL